MAYLFEEEMKNTAVAIVNTKDNGMGFMVMEQVVKLTALGIFDMDGLILRLESMGYWNPEYKDVKWCRFENNTDYLAGMTQFSVALNAAIMRSVTWKTWDELTSAEDIDSVDIDEFIETIYLLTNGKVKFSESQAERLFDFSPNHLLSVNSEEIINRVFLKMNPAEIHRYNLRYSRCVVNDTIDALEDLQSRDDAIRSKNAYHARVRHANPDKEERQQNHIGNINVMILFREIENER